MEIVHGSVLDIIDHILCENELEPEVSGFVYKEFLGGDLIPSTVVDLNELTLEGIEPLVITEYDLPTGKYVLQVPFKFSQGINISYRDGGDADCKVKCEITSVTITTAGKDKILIPEGRLIGAGGW